jgi:ATP-dependent DNA helicase RecQ
MEAMMNYALMEEGCRSRYIQEYFGEQESKDCGSCDLCIARRKGPKVSAEVTPERVLEIVRTRESISPRDLVREFRSDSGTIAEVVVQLLEEEKIYTDKGGNLKIKR